MVLRRHPKSAYWHYDFTVGGRRFRGSTEAETREVAQAVEAKLRSDLILGTLSGRKPEMTLDAAFGRYWIEHAQRLPSADDIGWHGAAILAALGKTTALHDLTDSELAHAVARWRGQLADSSVNRRLTVLRAVLRMAAQRWGAEIRMPNWQAHWLREPAPRDHILSEEEERALFKHLRPDFHAIVRFALLTGLRLENCLGLTWQQIDWDARLVRFRIKSKSPGGEVHVLPLTATMAAIFQGERGRHPNRVFTYTSDRSRCDRGRRTLQRKGERYPFTKGGLRKGFLLAIDAAGIKDFRFHDLRHTAATRALQAHRNLKTVQKMLGHKDISTTLRYVRSDVDDVRAAMEAVEAQAPTTALTEKREKTK